MKIGELFVYRTARVLHLIRTSFFDIAVFIKKVKDESPNEGYSVGFTISLLWLQLTTEFSIWDKWKI
jgi:hypothetical protein